MTSDLRIPLPDPQIPRTWREQMALEQLGPMQFRSLAGAPFGVSVNKDGVARPRAYGGHVYAQAAYAASKTIRPGFVIHNMSGYFTVIGLADEPFMYEISVIRDGGNYSQRRVEVWQTKESNICFSGSCSFKRPEPKSLDIQVTEDMEEKYHFLLGGKKVKDLPVRDDFKDMRAAIDSQIPCISTTFPAMYTSFLPFEKHHKTQAPIDRTSLYIYSARGEANDEWDPNLDACAHLYHSDRESVWSILRNYELLDVMEQASSLCHMVVFHGGPEKYRFHDKRGRRWFFQEASAKRISDGRGLYTGKIYDADGNHVLSMMQDGAIKLKWKSDEQREKRQQDIKTAKI